MQSNLTHLSPTVLHIRQLPAELSECRHFHLTNVSWDKDARIVCSEENKDGSLRFKGYEILTGENANDWQILGLMTSPTELTFDPAPYLPDGDGVYYLDFVTGLRTLNNKHDSLLSLLSVHGKHWKNPMGEKPRAEDLFDSGFNLEFNTQYLFDEVKRWKHYEDTLLTGSLLFLKQTK